MANVFSATVKSAWLSKINWTQAVGLIAGVLTMFGFNLDPETQAQVLAVIVGVQSVLSWFFRTFMTTSVTPSSTGSGG